MQDNQTVQINFKLNNEFRTLSLPNFDNFVLLDTIRGLFALGPTQSLKIGFHSENEWALISSTEELQQVIKMTGTTSIHLVVEAGEYIPVKKEDKEEKRGSRPQRKKERRTKANIQKRPAKAITKKRTTEPLETRSKRLAERIELLQNHLNNSELKEERKRTLTTRLGKLQGSFNDLQEEIVLEAMSGLALEPTPEATENPVKFEVEVEVPAHLKQRGRGGKGRAGRVGGRGGRGAKANRVLRNRNDRQQLPEGLQLILNAEDLQAGQQACAEVKALKEQMKEAPEEAKARCRAVLREAQNKKQETFNRVLAVQKQQVTQAQKNLQEARLSNDQERIRGCQQGLREAKATLRYARSQLLKSK